MIEAIMPLVSEGNVRDLVVAMLGVGGATFIWTIVKSYLAVRDSAEGREDKAIARLETYERDCRAQLQYEREMGVYWAGVAGIYQHALRVNGIELPVTPPQPYSSNTT